MTWGKRTVDVNLAVGLLYVGHLSSVETACGERKAFPLVLHLVTLMSIGNFFVL